MFTKNVFVKFRFMFVLFNFQKKKKSLQSTDPVADAAQKI